MFDLNIHSAEFEALAAELLSQGQAVHFRARGRSMRPLIQDGALLRVNALGNQPPRLGDILLCKVLSGYLLVHRVVKVRHEDVEWAVMLQGDARSDVDGWFRPQEVLGRVTSIEHSGHQWKLDSPWAKTWSWLFALSWPRVKQVFIHIRAYFRKA